MPQKFNPKEPKEDTREEMVAKVQELRDEINKSFSGVDEADVDPVSIGRINQVFNDVIASIPPDPPPEPNLQRANLATTMAKLKTQIDAVTDNLTMKDGMADKIKSAVDAAEKEAKEADQKEEVAHPSGPSQSPQELQKPQPEDQLQPLSQEEEDMEEVEEEDEHGKKNKTKRKRSR